MTQSKAFLTAVTSVLLFSLTTVIGGFLYPGYSHISNFISELYAVDAPNADMLRYSGYIPSGILFFLFSVFAIRETPKSKLAAIGFSGVGIGYGLGTIVCGFFTCDAGCNPKFINPSLSQVIHNLIGLLTYIIVPVSIFLIAVAVRKWKNGIAFSNAGFIISLISFFFAGVLNTHFNSPHKGLIQRIIEGSILIWIVLSGIYIAKNKTTE